MKKELTLMTELNIKDKDFFEREEKFSEYLSKEGKQILEEELGINLWDGSNLEKIVTSKKRIDIEFYSTSDEIDSRVIVECQFGESNHDHLGKLISYASTDENIKYIVWIVEKTSQIHIDAIDLLNRNFNNSTDNKRFYLMEAKILNPTGTNIYSLKLNTITKPEEAEIENKQLNYFGRDTETVNVQFNFWSNFKNYTEQVGEYLAPPRKQHWSDFRYQNKISDLDSYGSFTALKSGLVRTCLNLLKVIDKEEDLKKIENIFEKFENHFKQKYPDKNISYTNDANKKASTIYIEEEWDITNTDQSIYVKLIEYKKEINKFIGKIK